MEGISFLLIFLSLAENLLIISLTFSLISLNIMNKRFFILVLLSMFTQLILRTFPVTPLVIVFIGVLVSVLYLKFIYNISPLFSFISATLSVLLYMFVERITVSTLIRMTNYNMQGIISNSGIRLFYFTILAVVFLTIIIVVKLLKVNLKDFFNILSNEDLKILADEEVDISREKRVSYTFYLVIIFLLIQALFINAHIWGGKVLDELNISNFFTSPGFINVIILFLNLTLLFLLRYLIKIIRLERNDIIGRIKEKNTLRLNWEKRAQIHDSNHHLGMLYMLLQMNNIERAEDYLKGMVGEIQNVDAIIRSGNQALNALIRSKISSAKRHGINMKIDVIARLNQMNVCDWDLNRIIGNLLDNSIEAIMKKYDGETDRFKTVVLVIEGRKEINSIEVITYGVVIPDDIESRIFQKGYSSKEEAGHGLGLAICKELVEKYKGSIIINKDWEKKYTSFQVFLPISK